MLYLAALEKMGFSHDIFFLNSHCGLSRSLRPKEAEGGRLVKEADFEAEKKIY